MSLGRCLHLALEARSLLASALLAVKVMDLQQVLGSSAGSRVALAACPAPSWPPGDARDVLDVSVDLLGGGGLFLGSVAIWATRMVTRPRCAA
jgi:hypothetical protein